jgi:hypothetical protein
MDEGNRMAAQTLLADASGTQELLEVARLLGICKLCPMQ